MTRSEMIIAIVGVCATVIVGIPGILAYLQIQPDPKDEFIVVMDKFEHVLRLGEQSRESTYFVNLRAQISVRNRSNRPIIIDVYTPESNATVTDEKNNILGRAISIDAYKPMLLNIERNSYASFIFNQALHNISKNTNDIEGVLRKNSIDIFGDKDILGDRYDGSATFLRCLETQNEFYNDEFVVKYKHRSILFVLSTSSGINKHCYVANIPGLRY